jgi:hypothetical protein
MPAGPPKCGERLAVSIMIVEYIAESCQNEWSWWLEGEQRAFEYQGFSYNPGGQYTLALSGV